MTKFKCKILIDKFLRIFSKYMKNPYVILLSNTSWKFQVQSHSRPRRGCAPFWSAQRLANSGLVQFSEHAQRIRFVFWANQIVSLESEHVQSDWKSVNADFRCWDLPRDRDSWSWPEEAQPLRTRVVQSLHIENWRTTWLVRNPRFSISIRISFLINSKVSIFLLFSTYIA